MPTEGFEEGKLYFQNEDGELKELDKKEKQELKGLKGQDRFFVKQMYQYRKDSLQKILEKWAKNRLLL